MTGWMDAALCLGRTEWTDPRDADQRRDAVEACHRCPVIAHCIEYAQQLHWSGVVVAGWVAPRSDPKRHPGRSPPEHPPDHPTPPATRPTMEKT